MTHSAIQSRSDISMLHCKLCGWEKPDIDFYISNKSTCKECVKERVRKNYSENRERYREYERSRASLPHRVKARQEYALSKRGKEASRRASMRRNNSDGGKEYKRQWAKENREKVLQSKRKYYRQNKDVIRIRTKSYREANANKYRSHLAVNNALRDGRLSKPNACEDCGTQDTRILGHHDDYAKPLDVRWLCPACHIAWHRENGEAANG